MNKVRIFILLINIGLLLHNIWFDFISRPGETPLILMCYALFACFYCIKDGIVNS